MRARNYKPIGVPIKLHLEFDQMTVGELSSILRQWQAILRSVWRESYEIQFSGKAPTARLLTISTSTRNSCDLVSDFAIHTLNFSTILFGPVATWPSVVGSAYDYLGLVWSQRREQSEHDDLGHVFIKGGQSPELQVKARALRDSKAGPRIETLWKTATSGSIGIVAEVLGDQRDDSSPKRKRRR